MASSGEQRGGTLALPADLRAVPKKVLESYVKNKVLQFVGEPAFASQVHMSPDSLVNIAQQVWEDLTRPNDTGGGDTQYKLVFRHHCLSLGCLDMDCIMCKQTPHRRCRTNFAQKYLSGDTIKAKCGAPITVEVFDPSTGQSAPANRLQDYHLEICILEGKAYSELDPDTATDEQIDGCILLTNSHGKELLSPSRGSEYSEDRKIQTRLVGGKAELALSILGSSIALLSGQKPSFRLLVRAVQTSTGQRAKHLGQAVSDAFVVATQRVKTAQKAEIPHVEEHVSKIEYVGLQTQNKLLDIRAAAAAVSIMGLNVVHNCITTVGQFKELMESCEKDIPLQDTLKKVLNFTAKGWQVAREHALRSVSTDNRMRIWCSDEKLSTGLLFKCHLGRTDLESPVGLLKKASLEGGHVTMEAVLPGQQTDFDRQMVETLQRSAVQCWWQPGHPGWSIWPADSEQFIQGVCSTQTGHVAPGPVQIVAPIPATLTGAPGQRQGAPRAPPPAFVGPQEPKPQRVQAPPPFRLPMQDVLPGHHLPQGEEPGRLNRNGGWNTQRAYPTTTSNKSAPGVHVDNSQLVPSPFDRLRESPNIPAAVPQSNLGMRNNRGGASAGPAENMPQLPSTLPVLNSADMASLQEIQQQLQSGKGAITYAELPGLFSKMSGLLGDLGGVMSRDGHGFSQMSDLPSDLGNRFTGKVSGALEDISGALAMIQDLLPSVASEQGMNLMAGLQQASQQHRDNNASAQRLTRRTSGGVGMLQNMLGAKRGAGGVAQGLAAELRGAGVKKLRRQNSDNNNNNMGGPPRIRTRNSKQFD